MKLTSTILAFASITHLFPANSAAKEDKWEIVTEISYSEGNYGSEFTTEVFYAPTEIRRLFNWGEIAVAIPYLWYRSSGSYSVIDGTNLGEPQEYQFEASEGGLSDLLFEFQYKLLRENERQPEVLLTAYWKTPTANKSKGLSSGEHDWILGFEIWDWIPNNTQYFYFTDFYRFQVGNPIGKELLDHWIYDFGIGQLTKPGWVNKLSYKEKTALSKYTGTSRSLIYESEIKVAEKTKLISEFALGFSEATPDFSLMLGVEKRF